MTERLIVSECSSSSSAKPPSSPSSSGSMGKVVAFVKTFSMVLPFFSPASFAAECLEVRGDDRGAEDHALTSLERKPNGSSIVRCAHLARRARIASRRGDRSNAVGFLRAVAQVAMEEHVYLMAVLAGRECGGEEADVCMHQACDKISRPLEVVLSELAQEAHREGP